MPFSMYIVAACRHNPKSLKAPALNQTKKVDKCDDPRSLQALQVSLQCLGYAASLMPNS